MSDTRERYAPYIAGLVEREKMRRRARRERAARAMEAARRAAQLLRERYGVTRVRVFGSVLHPERFHERSDVDIAVEGLEPEDSASAWVLVNLNQEFEIDLVLQSECRQAIWKSAEAEGIEV